MKTGFKSFKEGGDGAKHHINNITLIYIDTSTNSFLYKDSKVNKYNLKRNKQVRFKLPKVQFDSVDKPGSGMKKMGTIHTNLRI